MGFLRGLLVAYVYLALATPAYAGNEPMLPAGLGSQTSSDDPKLPEGLQGSDRFKPDTSHEEPSLPSGLGEIFQEDNTTSVKRSGPETFLSKITGFAEFRGGSRIGNDDHQKQKSILESRLQLQWEEYWQSVSSRLTVDLLYDDLLNEHSIKLESGSGWLDIREAYLLFRPMDRIDLKIGRQILTWGTGDLVFINDLFPKDWNSFFTGRDNEYLKGPSDALKLGWFGNHFNLDLVYTPRFDADRYIDGSRISYFDLRSDELAGQHSAFAVTQPDDWIDDDELAVRLYFNQSSMEIAIYGYQGYWKSPAGIDPATGRFLFPRLRSLGASMRGPVYKGIANLELGYYTSMDDRSGKDETVRNSEFRMLLGYEQELATDLTGAAQFYLEQIQEYRNYLDGAASSVSAADRNRLVWTLRLAWLLMNQNLSLSLFNYYSSTDQDGYARVKGNYKISDKWQVELGLNLFYGEKRHTFFGQFEDNTNLYFAVRYGF